MTKKAKTKPLSPENPARRTFVVASNCSKPLSPEKVAILRTWAAASNEALRTGRLADMARANKVARSLGMAPPFGSPLRQDAFFENFLPTLLDAFKRKSEASIRLEVTRRLVFAFAVPYEGIDSTADDAPARVHKAVDRVLDATHLGEWATADTAVKLVRAAFRALGGSPEKAKKLLRTRD